MWWLPLVCRCFCAVAATRSDHSPKILSYQRTLEVKVSPRIVDVIELRASEDAELSTLNFALDDYLAARAANVRLEIGTNGIPVEQRAPYKNYEIPIDPPIAAGNRRNVTVRFHVVDASKPSPPELRHIDDKEQELVYHVPAPLTRKYTPPGAVSMSYVLDGRSHLLSALTDPVSGALSLRVRQQTHQTLIKRMDRRVEISEVTGIVFADTIEIENRAVRITNYDPYHLLKTTGRALAMKMVPSNVPGPGFYNTHAVLPFSARLVEFYDKIGNMSSSMLVRTQGAQPMTKVLLEPRHPLLGGWRAEFTLRYLVPLRTLVQRDRLSHRHIAAIPYDSPLSQLPSVKATIDIVLPPFSANVEISSLMPVDAVEEMPAAWGWLDVVQSRQTFRVHIPTSMPMPMKASTFSPFPGSPEHRYIFVAYDPPPTLAVLVKPAYCMVLVFAVFLCFIAYRRICQPHIVLDLLLSIRQQSVSEMDGYLKVVGFNLRRLLREVVITSNNEPHAPEGTVTSVVQAQSVPDFQAEAVDVKDSIGSARERLEEEVSALVRGCHPESVEAIFVRQLKDAVAKYHTSVVVLADCAVAVSAARQESTQELDRAREEVKEGEANILRIILRPSAEESTESKKIK